MSHRPYLAFDLETAKILPPDVSNIMDHRPLGITCAAAHALDGGKAFTRHGLTAAGTPAPQMSQAEAAELVIALEEKVREGYTLVTWNGLAFDFNVLAEESGQHEACAALARDHVDMMFHVVCVKGHFLGLQKAAEGMSLASKLEGVSPAEVPRLWAEGEHELVLEYVAQDARLTAELAQATEDQGALEWNTRSNNKARLFLPGGWLTVREALELPEPDNSWMSNPPRRENMMAWM